MSIFGRKAAPAKAAEHERLRLVSAADWAITAASRRRVPGGEPVAVNIADVVERAAEDGLTVGRAAAAEVLRARFELRAGGLGLTTDAWSGADQ